MIFIYSLLKETDISHTTKTKESPAVQLFKAYFPFCFWQHDVHSTIYMKLKKENAFIN